MTTMTLQEITEAINKWQEETGSTFILFAKDDTVADGKGLIASYSGKGKDLAALMASAIMADPDMEVIIKTALKGLILYREKQSCGSMN